MVENTKITFIGPGTMAESMISALLDKSVISPDDITAAGPRAERLEILKSRYGILTTQENDLAANSADVAILSVKPQQLERVMLDLMGKLSPNTLVISIIAGATIEKLRVGLKHNIVVRSMPNTPAQIGEGITVWTISPDVTNEQFNLAKTILGAMGDEVFVKDENYLDMATALSGTGPAYVFLFMESMVDAGVHLGFPRRIAEQLVAQTVRGSVDYYLKRSEPVHLARLRNEVTSPGGTSAAALYYLEKAGFRTAVSRAVWAAFERTKDLGKDAKIKPPEKE